ncbi:MAG: PDZ domain-containing protein, partial [Candidatus Methanomethylicaceae archaeon]
MMRKSLDSCALLIIFLLSFCLFSSVPLGYAQSSLASPVIIVHNVDSTSAPPEVRIWVSVIDRYSGQTIKGLTDVNFQLNEGNTPIAPLRVSREPAGLGIVVIVNQRALAARGDPRIGEALRLVNELMRRLSFTNAPHDDLVALIGVGNNLLEPEVMFTYPVDVNAVGNALMEIEEKSQKGISDGIGLFAEMNEVGQMEILELYENGPAQQAGLLPGDRILKVDDISIIGSTFQQSSALVCGPAGSTVKLLVEREGLPGPFEVKLTRSQIPISGGIGVSARVNSKGWLEVFRVYKGLPAEQAGINIGDRILKINDLAVPENASDEILKMLYGPTGSEVKLTIAPRQGSEPYEVTLSRVPVDICAQMLYNPPAPIEALEEALRLLTDSPDIKVREMLAHRRKVILLFTGDTGYSYDNLPELQVIRTAVNAKVSIYVVGIARPESNLFGADFLRRIAASTDGLFFLHNNEKTRRDVIDFFDHLMTQRQQYVLSYESRLERGLHPLTLSMNSDAGSTEQTLYFWSVLQPLQISVFSPEDGSAYQSPAEILLKVKITPTDGITRTPAEVRYFANGVYIGTSNFPPDFPMEWHVDKDSLPIGKVQPQGITLVAEAVDPYTGKLVRSQSVNIKFDFALGSSDRLWLLVGFIWIAVLTIGQVLLWLSYARRYYHLNQWIATSATGVLKGVTRRLGAPTPAAAKLVVVKGTNVGREIPLAGPVVKIARDPQFGDFALYDEYVSNPHFSIHQDQTQFYIVDEGSTNGTRVNGMPIPPHSRILLQPDAFVDVGMTRLQFKRVGGTT